MTSMNRLQSRWQEISQYFVPSKEFHRECGDYSSLLKFYDDRPVRSIAAWQARRQEILESWHAIMGPWSDVIENPSIKYVAETRRENFRQHKIALQIASNWTLPAYLLVPHGEGPFPAVLVPFYDAETGAGLSDKGYRDYGYQLTKRGFVSLSIGHVGGREHVELTHPDLQRLSFFAYVAANCWSALANLVYVDPERIGVVGHSFGGKWAMFAAALWDKFACGVWSDPGIVFDETRANVNYWESWYLGYEAGASREPGIPSAQNPPTGAYRKLIEQNKDLHEILALIAPRPFLVSGGAEDPPERWIPLNRVIEVYEFLGASHKVGMTNRPAHSPDPEANEVVYKFFEYFLALEEQ